MSDEVKWHNVLKVSDGERSFRACLSEHDGKHYATVLYCKRLNHALDLRLPPEKRPSLNFICHTACAGSQAEAVKDLDRWIKGNLGAKFAIEESRVGEAARTRAGDAGRTFS